MRAAKVEGILHLTGGWSDDGDSSLVLIIVMTLMMILESKLVWRDVSKIRGLDLDNDRHVQPVNL